MESMQYDIPLSRPISLHLYVKNDMSDIVVVYFACNPTWAVPFQKIAFSKFRIMSLLSFWSHYLENQNANQTAHPTTPRRVVDESSP